MTEPTLYVVATPIGNLGDMVPRAVETLQTVQLIAAEDTRHSAKLLEHFHIKTPLLAYHDHSDSKRTQYLIEKLRAGESIALISDAGTPLVSDPGYQLVAAAQAAGVRVVPIPGACALIAALAASGLASDRFSFEGFLPAKQVARQKRLAELVGNTGTTIFYEAPHRILESLQDVVAVFGAERPVVVARELTKTFETFLTGSAADVLAQVAADSNQQRGEIVLLVQGAPKPDAAALDSEATRIMALLAAELPPKKASALAENITGVKKKQLYQWYVDQK
ncbi:16S rRNA (cytidine(1402)-2'-O)-methyltransferase [Simiduia curdlanivorans]|uniref:Ribosomal RNA small subunit methyltransferase I n=1 Tax=Simiduia curdlanivorans TaxID=1492769 RepID=A0ABV8V6T7_9GAMM|nr:16S rRNA (cytidine(1402)-2'-O)-methyltransferase [Simiduia curdlanivorans]MDN3638959.1 16S rRNA (cytidine(1402)-2'-O)-methyltransferase [Simiduia curdlanivorans]